MATHSSLLAWRMPWTEEPGGYSPWGHKESDTTEQLTLSQRNIVASADRIRPGHILIRGLVTEYALFVKICQFVYKITFVFFYIYVIFYYIYNKI